MEFDSSETVSLASFFARFENDLPASVINDANNNKVTEDHENADHNDQNDEADDNEKYVNKIDSTKDSNEENFNPVNVIMTHFDKMSLVSNMEAYEDESSTEKVDSENQVSVCLTKCRYKVFRKVALQLGYKIVEENSNWNFYWTDHIDVECCMKMKPYQRISKFPGMYEICKKDFLARNLNQMLGLFPKEYNFFPKTWVLPGDYAKLLSFSRIKLNYSQKRRKDTFILKPHAAGEGRGICITRSLYGLSNGVRGVCQIYLPNPLLINGYKFDLRIYVLVTCCKPFMIYIYEEGLVRFATRKYQYPTSQNIKNPFMHLTNYTINKVNSPGSKKKLSWLKNLLIQQGHDVKQIWQRIDDIVIKTLICTYPLLEYNYIGFFPNHCIIPACCEILGFDIILDSFLNPILLEVNHAPSYFIDTELDREVKEGLVTDMFTMLNLNYCSKTDCPNEYDPGYEKYLKHETNNCGNFRLIYPNIDNTKLYDKFFEMRKKLCRSCPSITEIENEGNKNLEEEANQLWNSVETFTNMPFDISEDINK